MNGATAIALKRYLNRVCRVPADVLQDANAEALVAIAEQYQVNLEQFQASSQPAVPVVGGSIASSSASPAPPPGRPAPVATVREAHSGKGDDAMDGDALNSGYSGEFNAAGQREGHGRLLLANGSAYEGEWKADLYHGRGIYTDARGDVYNGHYKAGVMDGHGSFLFANGDHYEGTYSAGLMEGRGSFREGGSGDVYEGEFKAGNKVGRGMKTFASGESMLTWFSADEPVGEGVVWSADRAEVWRMHNGVPEEAISQAEAARIAECVDARGRARPTAQSS